MANLRSSKTRVGHNKKREVINKTRLTAVRTAIKKARLAIESGDKDTAIKAFRAAESALARAAGKGTIKAGTASRKTSRLAQAVKKM